MTTPFIRTSHFLVNKPPSKISFQCSLLVLVEFIGEDGLGGSTPLLDSQVQILHPTRVSDGSDELPTESLPHRCTPQLLSLYTLPAG